MNNISKVSHCSGCMACVDKCPKSCIDTKEDSLGHLVPFIIESNCIDCGVCLKTCPAENEATPCSVLETWATWRKNECLRVESSSGGLASVLAEEMIKNGGVVYGCAFAPTFSFKHIRCESETDMESLRGSKYLQSDTKGVYNTIAKDLKDKRKVLFVGTPCQVAGIKSFFKNKDENLYTVDLICHGVPSVKILKESLPPSILKYNITKIKFRDSTFFHFTIEYNNVTVYERALNNDLFLKGFFTALFYKECCYSCKYAKPERVGDITLGDFWGVDTSIIKTDPQKGISLCMVNTLKGKKLFENVSNKVERIERPVKEAIDGNKQLKHPMHKSIRTIIFQKLYPYLGFKWSVYLSIPEIIIKNKLFK